MRIGLVARQWSIEHHDKPLAQTSTNQGGSLEYFAQGEVFRHFQAMSKGLTNLQILICPNDVRRPAKNVGAGFSNTNVSYFVGLDANDTMPAMLSFGDRNLTNGPLPPNRILELTTNRPAGWTPELHNRQGNVALADCSVQGTTDAALRELVAKIGVATNHLALP